LGDSILNFMQGPPATAQNRWSGNRAGYDDPRAQQLLRAYYASLTAGERLQSARALSDFVAADLTLMPLYYAASFGVARRGVTALDGAEGGAGAGAPYGTYTRNAHLWDMLP
jgi:ABC-type oligopeptide transport system substrate-binding subunit